MTPDDALIHASDPDCYSCRGRGLVQGFGPHQDGRPCPCVWRCGYCDSPIPKADYSEGRPRRYDGVAACKCCRERYAAEDATAVDAIDMARCVARWDE